MIRLRTCGWVVGALLAFGPGAVAQERVRVSRVVDADTYEIISQSRRERVRLLGVDAPEQSQPFGAVATDSVQALDSVLVVRGWAWAYAPGRQRVSRVAEQQRAQAGGLGLWQCGADAAVPPWLWRGFNKEIKRHYRIDCPR